jgi:hydroxyacyl-ACP dehydratase HTD2-like protein with hotdog domain
MVTRLATAATATAIYTFSWSGVAPGVAATAVSVAAACGTGAVATLVPDPVMLFRYSALTGNGHRIHYDHPYVTGVEGYPGLIVHGPLQATLLAAHAMAQAPGRRLASFSFRGLRPAFAGNTLSLHAVMEGETARLQSRDDKGATCMQAEAVLG